MASTPEETTIDPVQAAALFAAQICELAGLMKATVKGGYVSIPVKEWEKLHSWLDQFVAEAREG